MNFGFAEDVEAFRKVINEKCKSNVWLTSIYGDRYNLKSTLSQYVALAKLIEDEHGQLELWADDKEDEATLMQFLNENPRIIGDFNLKELFDKKYN